MEVRTVSGERVVVSTCDRLEGWRVGGCSVDVIGW